MIDALDVFSPILRYKKTVIKANNASYTSRLSYSLVSGMVRWYVMFRFTPDPMLVCLERLQK